MAVFVVERPRPTAAPAVHHVRKTGPQTACWSVENTIRGASTSSVVLMSEKQCFRPFVGFVETSRDMVSGYRSVAPSSFVIWTYSSNNLS